jgi:hypothetical protein
MKLKILSLLFGIHAEPDAATQLPPEIRDEYCLEPPSIMPYRNKTAGTNVLSETGAANDLLFQQTEQSCAPTVIEGEESSEKNDCFLSPVITEEKSSSFKEPSIVKFDKQPDTDMTTAPVNKTPNRLPENEKRKLHNVAQREIIFQSICQWTSDRNPYSPEQTKLLNEIAKILSESWHTDLPNDKILVLTTCDFSTIVMVIRSLRGKVGMAELAISILLALVVNNRLYMGIHCSSASAFFKRHAEKMGFSPSRARDYCKRGICFLKYRKDILDGVGVIPGIPIEEFVSRHMSKLTLYDQAVEKFGAEDALSNLKNLTFREFQNSLLLKKPKNEKTSNDLAKIPSPISKYSHQIHEAQKAIILSLDLAPNEKRLLRIIAKGGTYYDPGRILTEDQVTMLEERLRQYRVERFKVNLKGTQYEPHDPSKPLAISEDLYKLKNIRDIVLRIRDSLVAVAPARRTIAILLFRLSYERPLFESRWKHPRDGVEYKSFRDFAMNELGMGEDYRDYIAVGRVLKDYYYFLDELSEIETDDVFLKLRDLPKALITHEGNEPLVLHRLRTLTIREFKCFSVDPDFEITFSKRLTKKKLNEFYDVLLRIRDANGMTGHIYQMDFIEIYNKDEDDIMFKLILDLIPDTEEIVPVTLPPPAVELDTTA